MRRRVALVTGLVVTVATISPPVHSAADALFSAHMGQHLSLMLVAAPLIAFGSPWRVRVGPIPIWIAATAVVWAWHLPEFYDSALASNPLHALEHVSFLVTSVLFWAFVMSEASPLARVGLTFATALQSSALGAVLAFASRPLYGSHLRSAASWGMTPLEDQQLAGAVMWVPPGVIYLAVMIVLLYRWFTLPDGRRDEPAVQGELS